jgi:hypothetical protein
MAEPMAFGMMAEAMVVWVRVWDDDLAVSLSRGSIGSMAGRFAGFG